MATRTYEFINGPESATVPTTGADPSEGSDLITKEYADNNYVQGGQAVADVSALKAVDTDDVSDNDIRFVASLDRTYYYDSVGTGTNDDVFIIEPASSTGRWFPMQKPAVEFTTYKEQSTPATPQSGQHRAYFKADGDAYMLDSAATEVKITRPTLGEAYKFDADGSDATITTDATDGDVVIAGTEALKISATGGLDMTAQPITTTTTNQGIVVAPNGTGPFQITTDGDTRGNSAVDLQVSRGVAAQVAGGKFSFIGAGGNNKITDNSGGNSWSGIVAGTNNLVVGSSAFIGAGDSNEIQNDAFWSGILAGGNNIISASTSGVLSGRYNTSAHEYSLSAGRGAVTVADNDFVLGNNSAATSSSVDNNHARIAGDTSDFILGRSTAQSSVAGATNILKLQTKLANEQDHFIGFQAADITADTTYVWPGDGTADYVLTTDGFGNLAWAAAAGGTSTLTEAYDAGATLTTDAVNGDLIIAGTNDVQLSGSVDLDVNDREILTTVTNGDIVLRPNGTGSFIAGVGAVGAGDFSISFGKDADATGNNSVAIGGGNGALPGAEAIGVNSVAIGYRADVTLVGASGVSLGYNTTVTGANAVAIGLGASATGSGAVSLRAGAAAGVSALAMGTSATVSAGSQYGVAIGSDASVDAARGVAVGFLSVCDATDGLSLGRESKADANRAVAVGSYSYSDTAHQIVFGGKQIISDPDTRNNIAKIDGATGDFHIGRYITQTAVGADTNILKLHGFTTTSQQDHFIGFQAPDLATDHTLIFPVDAPVAGDFLKITSVSGTGPYVITLEWST